MRDEDYEKYFDRPRMSIFSVIHLPVWHHSHFDFGVEAESSSTCSLPGLPGRDGLPGQPGKDGRDGLSGPVGTPGGKVEPVS